MLCFPWIYIVLVFIRVNICMFLIQIWMQTALHMFSDNSIPFRLYHEHLARTRQSALRCIHYPDSVHTDHPPYNSRSPLFHQEETQLFYWHAHLQPCIELIQWTMLTVTRLVSSILKQSKQVSTSFNTVECFPARGLDSFKT